MPAPRALEDVVRGLGSSPVRWGLELLRLEVSEFGDRTAATKTRRLSQVQRLGDDIQKQPGNNTRTLKHENVSRG